MAYDQHKVPALYKKLLDLYPRRFRERLGESMEQTFEDLYKAKQVQGKWFGFVLWMFAETGMGIFREHIFILRRGDRMKNILTNPKSAALISFILCLPLGVPFVALISDIEILAVPLNKLLTVSGPGSEINMLGRLIILGGLLLLPVAFILNLQPILVREGLHGKRTLHKVNLVIGAAILLLIAFTWGGLLMEQIYCLQGIRCD